MGIDTMARKRVSSKAKLSASTAVIVPASDRKVDKSDNMPPVDDTVFKDTLDQAHDLCVQAYASDEAADKLKGKGAQYMAAAIIVAYPVLVAKGKISQGDVPGLHLCIPGESDKARRLVKAAMIEHFATDTKPTGNNVQEQAAFALKQSAHRNLVDRGLTLAAHVIGASLTIDAFDRATGNWNVPLPMLTEKAVRNRTWVIAGQKEQIVPLANDPWGVTYLDHRGSSETIKFRSSERQFQMMNKPGKKTTTTGASGTTTTTTTASGTDERASQAPTPPAKASFKELTSPTGPGVDTILDVFAFRWNEMLADKSAPITKDTFDDTHWQKLSTLASSIQAVMAAITFNAADASSKNRAA